MDFGEYCQAVCDMNQSTLQQSFDQALQHHQAGRLREAESIYRQILAQQPAYAEVLHLLGVLAHQTGRQSLAGDLLRQAIALQPNRPEAYFVLGNVLKAQGELNEANAAWQQAIALNVNDPQTLSNLGAALKSAGQLDHAIAAFRQALVVHPNFAEAHNRLGNALQAKGRTDAAIAAYHQAIACQPNYAPAHYNLGNALREKGQLPAAIAAYQQALALQPNYPAALMNLGVTLANRGELDQAIVAFQRALVLKPNDAETHYNLGTTLEATRQLDLAIAAYRQTSALKPQHAEAYNRLSIALANCGQLDQAIAASRQALALRPDYAKAHSNLILSMNYHPGCDAAAIAEELRRWNRQHAEPLRPYIQPHRNDRNPQRRLRIGYVSADFRDHVVGRNLVPLLANHATAQFEIYAYADVANPDALTGQLGACIDQWQSIVGFSDEQIAEQVRHDNIDILVDLALHSGGNRLLVFARKPAPVQATFAGYPGSTGLTTIDYRLSDVYLDPPGTDESVYSEQTIRLPDSFWCYDPLDCRDIPVNPLPAIETGKLTFGCLNNFCKINEAVLVLWAQVLARVPGSRLLLMAAEGEHRQRTINRLEQEGLDPGRVEFVSRRPREAYLELYHRIDLGLDSFPYNGHTTSLDSFWMGVPVVTLVGQRAVARAGWCQLSNLGLMDLAGQTPEQFVQIAVDLANDLPRLAQLRATLRQRMQASPLMDAPSFARNVEAAYRQMWHKWCTQDNLPI